MHDEATDCIVCASGTYLEQSSSAGPCLNCSIAKALYDPGMNATKHDSEADCQNW